MKILLLVLLAILSTPNLVHGHPFAPPTLDTLANSPVVYMARVTTIGKGDQGPSSGKIRFSITGVLTVSPLLDPPAWLDLTPYPGEDFKKNSEWLLVAYPGGFAECVGWALKGDCAWLPIQLTRDGDKVSAQWLGQLDKIAEYLKEHPKQFPQKK